MPLSNENADRLAKEAASPDLNTNPQPVLEVPQVLTATTKPIIRRAMNAEWEASWEKEKHGRELFKLGVKPGKETFAMHSEKHRAISSVITQMLLRRLDRIT